MPLRARPLREAGETHAHTWRLVPDCRVRVGECPSGLPHSLFSLCKNRSKHVHRLALLGTSPACPRWMTCSLVARRPCYSQSSPSLTEDQKISCTDAFEPANLTRLWGGLAVGWWTQAGLLTAKLTSGLGRSCPSASMVIWRGCSLFSSRGRHLLRRDGKGVLWNWAPTQLAGRAGGGEPRDSSARTVSLEEARCLCPALPESGC